MHIAAVRGDHKTVKLLSIYGANPFIVTSQNYAPYDYATGRGNTKCIEALQVLMEKELLKAEGNTRDGFQTAKNNEDQYNRVKNNIDMINPPIYNNYTSRPRNQLKMIDYSLRSPTNNINGHYDFQAGKSKFLNYNNIDDFELKKLSRREKNRSYNLDFGRKRKISDNTSQNAKDSFKDSGSFLNQMNNFEERLEKIKNDFFQSPSEHNKNIENNSNCYRSNINNSSTANYSNESDYNSFQNKIPQLNTCTNKNRNTKTNDMLSYINFSNLIKTHKRNQSGCVTHKQSNLLEEKNYRKTKSRKSDDSKSNIEVKSFIMNYDDNRMITMKPEEITEICNNSRVTIENAYQEEDLDNQNYFKNENYSISKVNNNFWNNLETNVNSSKRKLQSVITEQFIDDNGVLAVFLSSKNDILDLENELEQENNFDVNRFSNANNPNYIYTEENILLQTLDKKNIKYFSKTNRSRTLKEDFKQISLDTQTINEHTIQYCNQMVDLIQSTEAKINAGSNNSVIIRILFIENPNSKRRL